MCGNLFCNDCSSHYYQLANHKAPVRTCQSCASVLERLKQLRQEDIDAPPEADDVSIRGRLNSHALRAPPQQQQPHGNEPITPPPSRGRNTSGPPSEPSTPGGLAIPRGRPGLNYSGAGGGAGAGGGGAGVLLTPPARISSSHNFGQHLTPTEGSPS